MAYNNNNNNNIPLRPFSRIIPVSEYQNATILDFTGAKDNGNGGDDWS